MVPRPRTSQGIACQRLSLYGSAEQKFAEPDVIHPKEVIGEGGRAAYLLQLMAVCRREHYHYLQDHQVAMEARPHRAKVSILIA